jgi:16S rRNA processing protein RimM
MNGRRVLLGRVVGVHGVRGAVRIESFTDPRSAIFNYKPWRLTGQLQGRDEVEVDHATPVSVHARTKSILAMLPGI